MAEDSTTAAASSTGNGIAASCEELEQSVFLMRHGARQDSAFPNWRNTAIRPYDTPLSSHGHLEAAQIATHRLKGKVKNIPGYLNQV